LLIPLALQPQNKDMFKTALVLTLLILLPVLTNSQVLTKEDSLAAGLISTNATTVISGYGSFKYSNNLTLETATTNVDRVVLFVGHKFNKRISFFSELEIENAIVSGGKPSGEFALEQAFLKFDINRNNYITAGLFIPRIGIINENHLPTTFNGNERTYVETFIIPATWREIGIGYYGNSRRLVGLNYSFALLNGLSSADFTSGTGIKDGRFEGGNASASALAVTGSLLYYYKNIRAQVSGYLGGSAGLPSYQADSLQLESGAFGTPVELLEANIQYNTNKLSLRGLVSYLNIPNAVDINRAYANNTPESILGFYAEASYNLTPSSPRSWIVFARYENLNMNLKLPENGILNESLNQQYVVAGIGFQPIKGVFVKLDYTYRLTGDINPLLIINPYPQSQPYFKEQHFIKLGLGYSF
jgi:hypothetical protein